MILIKKFYTRDWIKANPAKLVVFGDNLDRDGYGGQAGAARGEPNTVGIPTLPSLKRVATPADYQRLRFWCWVAFLRIEWHLMFAGDVVWPKEGVGTGIANLRANCPRLLDYIENKFQTLSARYGVIRYDD